MPFPFGLISVLIAHGYAHWCRAMRTQPTTSQVRPSLKSSGLSALCLPGIIEDRRSKFSTVATAMGTLDAAGTVLIILQDDEAHLLARCR